MAVSLVPVDFDSTHDVAELQRQRKICGWNYSDEVIAHWAQQTQRHEKALFWIRLGSEDGAATEAPANVGHIGLDSNCTPPDPSQASPDKTTLMIATFFVLPEHRRGGVGSAAVDAVEALARVAPHGSAGCTSLTINTLSREYVEDEAMAARLRGWTEDPRFVGLKPEVQRKGHSTEDWWARQGYVAWRREGKYPLNFSDGEVQLARAVYMRKTLV